MTQADRLRYAAALLRAGRSRRRAPSSTGWCASRARSSTATGARLQTPAICASTALVAGFPAVAVGYARTAVERDPHDGGTRLLLVRALTASGDPAAARPILRELTADTAGMSDGRRIELARWHQATGDAGAADRLLARKVPESVGQMFQDSVQANTLLARGDWAKAAGLLARASARCRRVWTPTPSIARGATPSVSCAGCGCAGRSRCGGRASVGGACRGQQGARERRGVRAIGGDPAARR